MANRSPDAGGAVHHAADEDSDSGDRQHDDEDQRVENIPGIPALDDPDRAGNMERDPVRRGAIAKRAEQHEHGDDEDLDDGSACGAEKTPDAIDGDVEHRAAGDLLFG